ncbi:MAG: clostripain-related cysteine peptidase [Bdellovibrionaceae bacterium]|nr:clostripain-related cysteine peptidase [Pseudobdellovibrionaceae bacterium]
MRATISFWHRLHLLLGIGALTLAWVLSAAAGTTRSLGPRQPTWFPNAACTDVVSERDPFAYDHRRDSDATAGNGNFGYPRYIARTRDATHGIDRHECFKEWTVLVYMAADNDLHPYALWDLHEMEGAFASGRFAGSTARSDLLVEVDLAQADGVRRLHMFQRPGREYTKPRGPEEFKRGGWDKVASPVVEVQRESRQAPHLDHKRRFADFLRWGMRRYPARHYLVIVWGHGQGWTVAGQTQLFPSGDDFALDAPTLGGVLRQVTADTLENKRRIDVFAADACLMQMVEVAYEVSDSTRFILGSSDVQSLLGLPYRRLLYEINTGHFLGRNRPERVQDEAHALARMLPTLAAQSLDPRRGDQGRFDRRALDTFTMSSLSSDALRQHLVPALHTLGRALTAYIQEEPARAMDIQDLLEQNPRFMNGAGDVGSFLGLLARMLREEHERGHGSPLSAQLSQRVRLAHEALQLTTITFEYGTGYRQPERPYALLGFRAVGLWLPASVEAWSSRRLDFQRSRFFTSQARSGSPSAWQNWWLALYSPSL